MRCRTVARGRWKVGLVLLSLPDLPLLKSIRLDYWSLCGDGDNRGCVKEKCPSVFLNQLIMKGG